MENVLEKPFTTEQIIELTGIHKLKVRNIFQYGSRVYGTNRLDSDYDVIVIACSMDVHKEKNYNLDGKILNIHTFTPDAFNEALKRHDIMNLECLFLPEQFIIFNSTPLQVQISKKGLTKNILAQSFNSWRGAKMCMFNGDIYRGIKGAFHSIRMLIFAIQIIESGRIIDYSAANYLYKEMNESEEYEWDFFKENYLPIKIKFEEQLKNLAE